MINWPRWMTRLTVPEITAADFWNNQFWLDIKILIVYFINYLAHYYKEILTTYLNLKSVFISRFQAAAPNTNIAANPAYDIHNGLGNRISSGLYCGWKRALGRNSDVWLQYCIDDHDNWSVFKYDSDIHNDVHNNNYNDDNHDNNNDNYYDKLVQHKIL